MTRWFVTLSMYILCACTKVYTMSDFIDSKWDNQFGTTLTLYQDGTFIMDNFRWDVIFEDIENSFWIDAPTSFGGIWSVEPSSGHQCINFSFERTSYSFIIENYETMYTFIGDPDECIYYELHRLKK